MKYITPATEMGQRVPPGADHKEKFTEYRMTPGVAWKCVDEATGEWIAVEVDEATAKTAEYRWCRGTVSGRPVLFFRGKDGVEYAQPDSDDPRAKDRELGSTRKRSRFMSALKKARAEEAARQGLGSGAEKSTTRERKPRAVKKRRALPELDLG